MLGPAVYSKQKALEEGRRGGAPVVMETGQTGQVSALIHKDIGCIFVALKLEEAQGRSGQGSLAGKSESQKIHSCLSPFCLVAYTSNSHLVAFTVC